MNEILINVIGAVVTLVLIPLLTWGGKALINLINEKVKNEKVKKALTAATEIVGKTVEQVAQTYVDELKKNGTFTADSQKQALAEAIDSTKELLSDEIKKQIVLTHTDLDKWLTTQIESCVRKLKGENCQLSSSEK